MGQERPSDRFMGMAWQKQEGFRKCLAAIRQAAPEI